MPAHDIPSVTLCQWKHDAPFAYSMTYDEGTVDTLANALPVHERFGFPGHVDVVAGQLGRPRDCFQSSMNGYQHMGVDELRTLMERGWGVGNHSWSHYVYPCQPGLDLYREVVWSKYRLEDALERPVRIFTIPNETHNYPPVIELVKQHYLACAYIEGAPNRGDFDLYQIGNCLVAVGGFRPRPGWPVELKTENLTSGFLQDSWLYETTHLCLWDVPQAHKCVTPAYLSQRFEVLNEISEGKLWAATPDDVIDYELLRRHLQLVNVRSDDGAVAFEVEGQWPVGVVSSTLTLRLSGVQWPDPPAVEQQFHKTAGGYGAHNGIEAINRDGDDWLITMQLAPDRTVRLKPPQVPGA
jgi:hypothetical protein